MSCFHAYITGTTYEYLQDQILGVLGCEVGVEAIIHQSDILVLWSEGPPALPCWSCELPREGRAPWALSGLPSGPGMKLPLLGKAAPVSVKSQAQPNPTCARPA